MSIGAAGSSRLRLAAAVVPLLAAGLVLACATTGEVGPFYGTPGDGGVPVGAGTPGASGQLLSVECGPFGPSRLTRLAEVQPDPHLAVADFDCDGRPDAVTSSISYGYGDPIQGSLRLRPGNGDGTFRDASRIDLGEDVAPVNMVAGDFNADGAPDLVVAGTTSSGDSVLVSLAGSCGAKAWSPEVIAYPNPFLGTDMAAADMNQDGIDDLVLARWVWPIRVDVMLGGPLPFQRTLISEQFSDATPEGKVRSIAVGDFDGDGRGDVAAVTGKGLDLLLGNNAGPLTHAAHLDGTLWFSLEAADLDDDGTDELIAMSTPSAGITAVDAYDYDATSGGLAGRTLLEARGAGQVRPADLDGDGRIDLAVAGVSSFESPTELLLSGSGPLDLPSTEGALQLADVTGDGRTDLVYLASYGLEAMPHLPPCPEQPVTCSSGAAFSKARSRLARTPERLLFGDVTGNGAPDVVTVDPNGISMLDNDGSGQLAGGFDVAASTSGVAIAELDRNAGATIIAVDGSAGWMAIHGDGSLDTVRPAGFPTVADVAAGDFNGDLEGDLAFTTDAGLLIVPRGDPAARFMTGLQGDLLAAVDFDFDGRTDLLLAPEGATEPCVVRGPVSLGSSCEPIAYAPERPLDVEDFDGDQQPDILFEGSPMTVSLWAHGSSVHDLLAPDYGWLDAHALHRVGEPPALLLAAKGGALAVYAGDGSGVLGPGGPVLVQQSGVSLVSAATEDLDGDGTDEILGVTGGSTPALWVLHRCGSPPIVH